MTSSALSGLLIPLLWIGGMISVLFVIKLLTRHRDRDDEPS